MSNQITPSQNNALVITNQYPADKFNLLVPMQTVAEISELQKPVMNVVYISTDLNDKEIYEQEKAKKAWKDNPAQPAKYAITKKGLTKLMRAAGIKIVWSKPIVPTACQKCANINASIGRPVRCGDCTNKDVKYEVCISVPQLTGENIEIIAHKEIIVNDVIAGMTDRQRDEFLKFRNEMCESKALNRALREAMQIKGTYLIEEFEKPFVVAYLVPNLDHEAVREAAVQSFFRSSHELYGGNNPGAQRRVYVSDEPEGDASEYEASQLPMESSVSRQQLPPARVPSETAQNAPDYDPTICVDCGRRCSNAVVKYSQAQYGMTLCMDCQKRRN